MGWYQLPRVSDIDEPQDAEGKAALLRLVVQNINKKTDIVQLDADDVAETVLFDPIYNHNSEFDVSTIIQDGFQEQRVAEGFVDAAIDDDDVDESPNAKKKRTDTAFKGLLQNRYFRKEDFKDGEELQKHLDSICSGFKNFQQEYKNPTYHLPTLSTRAMWASKISMEVAPRATEL